jgi:competence protein ComEC
VTQLADGAFVTLALRPDAFSLRAGGGDRHGKTGAGRLQGAGDRRGKIAKQKMGAMGLRRTGDGFVAEAIRPRGLDRPWSPAVPDAPQPEAGVGRSAISRPVDATPTEADVQGDEQ